MLMMTATTNEIMRRTITIILKKQMLAETLLIINHLMMMTMTMTMTTSRPCT